MSEKRDRPPAMVATTVTTSEERTVAALAHASTLFTLLVALPTAGLGGILFVFVPFLIYLSYRDKSRFVAFHAAQAFALQVIGTVGIFVLIIVSALLGALLIAIVWVITGLLTVILIGIILIPVAILVTLVIPILLVLVWLGAPFVLGVFGLVGAVETANGRDYHSPYVGDWVDDWLNRQEISSAPAV